MFKDYIESLIEKNFSKKYKHQVLEVKPPHKGDFSSNIAFLLAKEKGRSPKEIAEEVVKLFTGISDFKVEAINGYLNFEFNKDFVIRNIFRVFEKDFAKVSCKKRILVEYVSANPTGPLNVVQARAGSYGSTLVNLLRDIGCYVEAEYYVNDAGGQVERLKQSIVARMKQLCGETAEIPEDGYHGEYVIELAKEILEKKIPEERIKDYAVEIILSQQKSSLQKLGIFFDNFVKESWIRKNGYVERVLNVLKEKNLVEEKEGALYFKSSVFGDDKDRVLIKSNGEYTYFLTDVAYHLYKIERGFNLLINIWGPDHYGYIKRMESAMEALGYPGILKVIIVQHVSLKEKGREISFSKRKGQFITLDELLSWVGKDAVRFFMLLRKESQHLDFDLSLAKKLSVENPVYYVQYGHARIKSILRRAKEKGFSIEEPKKEDIKLLSSEEEMSIMKKILYFEDVLKDCAKEFEPHRMVYYLLDISRIFHYFYEKHKVLVEDERIRKARIFIARAVAKIIKRGLSILGVDAPEYM